MGILLLTLENFITHFALHENVFAEFRHVLLQKLYVFEVERASI
jgi:hypothetical protein